MFTLWREKRYCPSCKKVRAEKLDFTAEETPHLTKEYSWWLGRLCEINPVSRAAEFTNNDPNTLWRYLTVIPRCFYVVQQKRVKYRCSCCQEGLITAPVIPRIKSGSSYSDEMVVNVALSKYCDLIPVERYVQMASRSGVSGLPANTLIEGTHNLAIFLAPVYKKI